MVLADSPIVVQRYDDTIAAITDDRINHLPDYSVAGISKLRNSPDGFWVVSTRPEAGVRRSQERSTSTAVVWVGRYARQRSSVMVGDGRGTPRGRVGRDDAPAGEWTSRTDRVRLCDG